MREDERERRLWEEVDSIDAFAKNKHLSSERLYKLQTKISGLLYVHIICITFSIIRLLEVLDEWSDVSNIEVVHESLDIINKVNKKDH